VFRSGKRKLRHAAKRSGSDHGRRRRRTGSDCCRRADRISRVDDKGRSDSKAGGHFVSTDRPRSYSIIRTDVCAAGFLDGAARAIGPSTWIRGLEDSARQDRQSRSTANRGVAAGINGAFAEIATERIVAARIFHKCLASGEGENRAGKEYESERS